MECLDHLVFTEPDVTFVRFILGSLNWMNFNGALVLRLFDEAAIVKVAYGAMSW